MNKEGLDLFQPRAFRRLAEVPGWSVLGLPAEQQALEPAVSLLESLRAIDLHERSRPQDEGRQSLVATLPTPVAGVSSTRDTLRALIGEAVRELMVMGFSISDREMLELLMARAADGVDITVVGDRTQNGALDVWRSWPAGLGHLVALHDVEPMPGQHLAMHAKVLVADRRRALIGSANFTVSGLGANIELGVLVSGPVCEDVCRTVESLRRQGWLVPVG